MNPAAVTFNGLGTSFGNLARLSNAQTRSLSLENFTGAKGKGGLAENNNPAACELGRLYSS